MSELGKEGGRETGYGVEGERKGVGVRRDEGGGAWKEEGKKGKGKQSQRRG